MADLWFERAVRLRHTAWLIRWERKNTEVGERERGEVSGAGRRKKERREQSMEAERAEYGAQGEEYGA
jgi:hypothetical protein